jgi:capsular exopolysaccharide synthesis family protein
MVIANGVLDEYLNFAEDLLSEDDRKLLDELKDEGDKLMVDIAIFRGKVAEARKDLQTGSPDELIAQRRLRREEREADLGQLNYEIAWRQKRMEELEDVSATSQPSGEDGSDSPVDCEDDAEWRRLSHELTAAQDEAELGRRRFGPKSDTMVQLEKAVESAREALARREAHLHRLASRGIPLPTVGEGQGSLANSLDALRDETELLKYQRDYRKRELEELRESFGQEFDAAESLRRNTDELEDCEKRLEAVQRRLDELDEKRRVPATIRTVGRATLPSAPEKDKRRKLSLAALIGALGAALACAYLRLAYSSQVQDAAEVRREVRGAFLGYLPLRRGQDSLALEESPVQAESVRMVRTALLNRLDAIGGNVVQVTSAGLGSGKSTLAALLARSMALCGKSVLLVDADTRRASLAKRFSIDPSPGLIQMLADRQSEAGGIHTTSIPGLSVLPAGVSAQPGELDLLADGAFATLLERWRERYDIVVLDSAPLLATADAAILARHADGAIMVVRERHCRRPAVVEALAVLSAAGGKLLGTVFVGSGHGGAYGYGYGYGYEAAPQLTDE